MMNAHHDYSICDESYFGISHLDMGSYGAHLMTNRVVGSQDHGSKLHFDEAKSHYHADKRALTIEGLAGPISTPWFAVSSLEAYASIAREMDELLKPLAS